MTVPAPGAVLAVDVGSSCIRVSLVDVRDGTIVDTRHGTALGTPEEIELESLWREICEMCTALDRDSTDVIAVSVAAQLGTALLDDRHRALRPVLTWRDARGSEEAAALADALSPEQLARTGRRMSPDLTAVRLRWLRHHEPDAVAGARWVLSLKDALVCRMTGAVVTDETNASYTGMFDVHRRGWDPELAAAAGVTAGQLPPTAPGAAVAGRLTAQAANALGLPERVPCAVGGPDGTVGALGAGAVLPGTTVDIAGTTDVLVHLVAAPPADPSRRCVLNAHLLPGLWTVGGPTGLTGGVVEWVARMLGYDTVATARTALEEQGLSDRLADGPVFLPALGGSRFPTWRAHQRGGVVGLRPEHGPADVFGAAQLGVACAVGLGLDALRELGEPVDAVIIAGGAARHPGTLQLRSDVWGVDVHAPVDPEATTTGAAVLGALAAGAYDTAAQAVEHIAGDSRRFRPSRDRARWIDGARGRWRRAWAGAERADDNERRSSDSQP